MSKRSLEDNTSTSNKRTNSGTVWNTTVVDSIAQFLSVPEILNVSLVNQDFAFVLNSDAQWKKIFEMVYADRLINEKDPVVGGEVFESVKSKFSSLHKAHYAMKKSFSKLTILSHENVFKKYSKLFVGEVDECSYKDGDENFEPTLEMKQLASSWFSGGSDSTDCENKYAYFFKEELAEYETLLLTRIKNELTNQVIKLVEISCSNPYGSVHLENDEKTIANSSEGCFYVNEDDLNNDGVYTDMDLVMWIQRISNSITGCPEHSLSYLDKGCIKLQAYLGPRDENNLLDSKYPIKEEDDEEEKEVEDEE